MGLCSVTEIPRIGGAMDQNKIYLPVQSKALPFHTCTVLEGLLRRVTNVGFKGVLRHSTKNIDLWMRVDFKNLVEVLHLGVIEVYSRSPGPAADQQTFVGNYLPQGKILLYLPRVIRVRFNGTVGLICPNKFGAPATRLCFMTSMPKTGCTAAP